MANENLFDDIARVAYELFERSGYIHGRDLEHWFEAERIVVTRLQPEAEEKPKKPRAPRKTSPGVGAEAVAAKPKAKKPAGTTKQAAKTKK
ncbi:DUF2934 domain-containing protein [Syntrophorhabdus aromaticivorans]|uniref:DUF2934 domain-containing protein n=1 Tax=Syntrophorhabdus aromaticivorans TaxID=328301 RepID=UPI000403D2FF|nr:DUF2934 domain-containing protein [Syntrophorhabdus aromaticivorans]HBA53705.1 DUF2934 domain-containing protein [Syntrophorhabdus aromaticivorans]